MTPKATSALAVLAVCVLLAGCSGPAAETSSTTPPPPPPPDTQWAARAIAPDEGGHDHRKWQQHTGLSTPNFQELAHDPLGIPAFGNKTAGGYFCGGAATTTEGRRISVISSFDTSVAFVVVDSTDPAHLVHLGDYVLDRAQTYDVDVTPDGRHVVIAADVSQGETPPGAMLGTLPDTVAERPQVTLHTAFRDACTGTVRAGPDQTVAAGPSTILVSIADPRNPTFESLVPSPVIGPHSVSTAVLGQTTYVASSITNLVHHASYFQFFQLMDLPTGTTLVQTAFVDSGQYGATGLVNGHVDAEMSLHPVTGKPVVYLSDWDGGLIVLDFSVPQAPLLLGTWADAGASGGQMHSTRSIEGVHNGHHYLLAGQEFTGHPSNRPSGWVYILDDTDPTNIQEVGRWTLPVDTQADWSGVELFSTHYFRVLNDTVFVAMYHGGVWAFKLDFDHPEAMKEPRSVGVFVPDGGPQDGRDPTGFYDLAPFVLDVFPYPNGDLVIYDGLSGVYSVHYAPAKDMPSPTPWPAKGK